MNLKDQQYMMSLSFEGSMTRAAERLGISQPALSKWLSELEREIGQILVVRSKNGILFTEAGQIYLEGCRACMDAAFEIRRGLEAMTQTLQQCIILGGSPSRGAQAFARLFRDFRSRYPQVNLQFIGGPNTGLTKMLLEGELTMSLLGSVVTHIPNLEYLKFMDEELLFMLPKGHRLSYDYASLEPNQPYPVIDLKSLTDTPLLANQPATSYYDVVRKLYRDAGLESNIIFESSVIPLLYEMVLNGVGAALIPDSYYNPEDGISVYSLSPRLIVYQGIGIRSGYSLSEAEEYLIHLLMNNWGAPYYMHQYADYYLEQRKRRAYAYEHHKI